MIKAYIVVPAALLLTACIPAEPSPLPMTSTSALATQSTPIVNGTRAPQNTFLSEDQMLAIGFLAGPDGSEFCTGTLIEPRVVITASHCTEGRSPSTMLFGVGLMPRTDGVTVFPIASIIEHPTVDFAILILGIDVKSIYPNLVTIEMNREVLSEDWKERWVDASGYGDTYSDDSGRFFASVQIENFDETIVQVNGHGEQGICYGDSGGPILWQPDMDTAPVIVGTEQWGDETCVDIDYLTRVDQMAAWVDEQLAGGLPPELEPCEEGADTSAAFCNEDILTSCTQGYLVEQDCMEAGRHCGYLGSRRGYRCLPSECGEIDYYGACEGGILYYCNNRGLRTQDCAAQSEICMFVSEEEGYDCQPCMQCGDECIDPNISMDHCGGCDQACAPAHARGECVEGVCQIADCQEGFEDADGDATTGCESLIFSPDASSGTQEGKVGEDEGCHSTPVAPLSLLFAWYAFMLLKRRQRGSQAAELPA